MKYVPYLMIIFISGCEFFQPKETTTEPAIARSMDSYLYRSDLTGLIPENISKEDSTKLSEKYVLDWVKKQLMISKSADEIDFVEAEIERKVLDYRYALMVHAFERKYINKHLNTEVNSESIESYYHERSENFLLKQNIIKCIYAQIPESAPNIRQFRRNFKAYPEGNVDDLKSYITQFAVKSYMEDSTWIIFDDLILGTPMENIENKNTFLTRNKYSETSKDGNLFFIKIFDYKISNEVSPLEFIQDQIRDILINKRKIALKKELEEKIYDEAKQNSLFEIYR